MSYVSGVSSNYYSRAPQPPAAPEPKASFFEDAADFVAALVSAPVFIFSLPGCGAVGELMEPKKNPPNPEDSGAEDGILPETGVSDTSGDILAETDSSVFDAYDSSVFDTYDSSVFDSAVETIADVPIDTTPICKPGSFAEGGPSTGWKGVKYKLDDVKVPGSLVLAAFAASGDYTLDVTKIIGPIALPNNIGTGAIVSMIASTPGGTALTITTQTSPDGATWPGVWDSLKPDGKTIASSTNPYLKVNFHFYSPAAPDTPELDSYTISWCTY